MPKETKVRLRKGYSPKGRIPTSWYVFGALAALATIVACYVGYTILVG